MHPEHGIELLDGQAIGHGDVVTDGSPVFEGVGQNVCYICRENTR